MFAFYDTNAGKNIINALNVRVLWYERGEKYHKCLDFPDFMIQECLQNIINHVGFAICDTKSSNLGCFSKPKCIPIECFFKFGVFPQSKIPKTAVLRIWDFSWLYFEDSKIIVNLHFCIQRVTPSSALTTQTLSPYPFTGTIMLFTSRPSAAGMHVLERALHKASRS